MKIDFLFNFNKKTLTKCLKKGYRIENIATYKSTRKMSWDIADGREFEFVVVYIERGMFKTISQYKNGDIIVSKFYKIEDYFKSCKDMLRILEYLDYEYVASKEGSLLERIKKG